MKKQQSLTGMTYADIAKATGYKEGTIKAFMCGYRQSEEVANHIAEVLGISVAQEEKAG